MWVTALHVHLGRPTVNLGAWVRQAKTVASRITRVWIVGTTTRWPLPLALRYLLATPSHQPAGTLHCCLAPPQGVRRLGAAAVDLCHLSMGEAPTGARCAVGRGQG